MGRYDEILARFMAFAAREPRILMGVQVGSGARKDRPADEFSDLDLLVVVTELEPFLSGEWLSELGDVKVRFTEPTFCGGKEMRILYDGALDVDFPLLTPTMLDELLRDFTSLFARGAKVLFDRMNGTARIMEAAQTPQKPYEIPSEAEFDNLTQDFWYHTVWTAKKILRGETWAAKQCLDGYLRSLLRRLLEMHAHALHGEHYDTWHDGRFLDCWAEPWVAKALKTAYAPYDLQEMPKALMQTANIFRRAAKETAEKYGYPYPEAADVYTTQWVQKAFEN